MVKVWTVLVMGKRLCISAETKWEAIQHAMWKHEMYKVSTNVKDYKVK